MRLDSPAMDRFRRFDEAYYHRFYDSPQTRVTSPEEHAGLAEYVFAFARYNKVEMKSVLDVGAGVCGRTGSRRTSRASSTRAPRSAR